MIGLIDYGLGNITAFQNVYKKLNIPVQIADVEEKIKNSDKLILPGVGSFDTALNLLETSGLKSSINEMVIDKKMPILGICVGMQIMTEESEEGSCKGLGWIKSKVKKLSNKENSHLPIPHMGWNELEINTKDKLFLDIQNPIYYFLHSYYVELKNKQDMLSTTTYINEFVSGFRNDNIFGVQFHPEKSHHNGETLLKNFALI